MKLLSKDGKRTFNLPDRLAQRLINKGSFKAVKSQKEEPAEEIIPAEEVPEPEIVETIKEVTPETAPEEVIPEAAEDVKAEEVPEVPVKKAATKSRTSRNKGGRGKKK